MITKMEGPGFRTNKDNSLPTVLESGILPSKVR